MQQKLEVAKLDGYFCLKQLWICLKQLQNTKDLRSRL